MIIRNDSGHLRAIRKVADYQFGKGAGERLFPDDVRITFSKKTGRIRQILHGEELIAALNPNSGLLNLSIEGARRLARGGSAGLRWVKVQDGVSSFIENGSDVFAKHVVDADYEIRPMDEVIVFNSRNEVIAVGKAVLSGAEMLEFNKGVAVKVRKGISEKTKKEKGAK
jgi:predicted RNA-binding protein (TIGR00451 family)